jgi:hypothetical protein
MAELIETICGFMLFGASMAGFIREVRRAA